MDPLPRMVDEGLFSALQRRSMNREIILLLGSADLMLLPLLQVGESEAAIKFIISYHHVRSRSHTEYLSFTKVMDGYIESSTL